MVNMCQCLCDSMQSEDEACFLQLTQDTEHVIRTVAAI